ncbi:MAG: hypothetical protein AB7K64_22915, partial [Variibacter sp.]
MNVIDSHSLGRDAGGKPLHAFPRPALGPVPNRDSPACCDVIQASQTMEAWMAKQVYWLSDAEWRRIEPLLPRGRRGAH